MRKKLGALLPLLLLLSLGVNAQGPLAKRELSGISATSNTTVNATLDPAFVISGTINAGGQLSIPTILAVSGTGASAATFFGEAYIINNTTITYRIVVPAGMYSIEITFPLTNGEYYTVFTYEDSAPPSSITISGDTIHNITMPPMSTSAVTGTISGLNPLFSGPAAPQLVFTSASIPGFLQVQASGGVGINSGGTSGGYSVELPNGTFTAQLTQNYLSSASPEGSALVTSFGPSAISGPTTLNLTVLPVTTAILSGTVSYASGSDPPTSSGMFVKDVSTGTPPPTVSSGSVGLGPTGGSYSLILAANQTYALDPVLFVPILPSPAPLAIYTPPDPAPALLTENTTRNVMYPAVPGPSTGYTISGKLTITGTISPVANASAQALGENITGAPNTFFNSATTTDAYGNYSIEVPAGTNYYLIFQGQFVTSGDFDGDGKADISVFRPSNGEWYVIPSLTPNTLLVQQWGTTGDIPVRGNFLGTGKEDFAVFRPSNGTWYVIPSFTLTLPAIQQWGTSGDIPVPGGYDGDGKTDFAVFRPSNGTWYIIPSSNPSSVIIQQWGTSGDIPIQRSIGQ